MKLKRRHFLGLLAGAIPAMAGTEACLVEPEWLAIRKLRLGTGPVWQRFVQFTDVHYRGDAAYLRRVVTEINRLAPDFVCFTGDLVEDARFFAPALALLGGIRAPLFGIPGNHDHWCGADFGLARRMFAAGGGAWLQNEQVVLAGGEILLTGADRLPCPIAANSRAFNLLLMHYPLWAEQLRGIRVDLVLAGHSHGGQVRIPGLGALIKPSLTGRYELGQYETPAGMLYVNPGIGTFHLNVRFNCRPELTVFELGSPPYRLQDALTVA